MSDLNFDVSEAYKPADRQISNLSFAVQSLQIGGREMQAISGKAGDTVLAAGFASADDLLSGFSDAQPASSNQVEPANPDALIAQLNKAYAHDTSPDVVRRQVEKLHGQMSADEYKSFIDARIAGQKEAIENMPPQQLQIVANLADAIKKHDNKQISKILQDVPADITNKIAFAVQYQLQAEGVNKIGIESRNIDGKGYLYIEDGITHMQQTFNRVTGENLGFSSMEILTH